MTNLHSIAFGPSSDKDTCLDPNKLRTNPFNQPVPQSLFSKEKNNNINNNTTNMGGNVINSTRFQISTLKNEKTDILLGKISFNYFLDQVPVKEYSSNHNDQNSITIFGNNNKAVEGVKINTERFNRTLNFQKKDEEKNSNNDKEIFKYLDDLNLKVTKLKHEMSKKLKQDDKFFQQRIELKNAFELLEKKIFQCLLDTMNQNSHNKKEFSLKKKI